MDRGAWWATVHGVAESSMTEWLSTHTLKRKVYYVLALFLVPINLTLFMSSKYPTISPSSKQTLSFWLVVTKSVETFYRFSIYKFCLSTSFVYLPIAVGLPRSF